MNKLFPPLLIFVPITVIGYFLGLPEVSLFILAALAIIPLAKYIGDATEELTFYTGSGVGGLLNATFGNVTELIIGIIALHAGLLEVVKASITGSILSNLLLILGMATFFGGRRKEKQTFNAVAAKASSSTLLLAVVALVIPAIFTITSDGIAPLVVEKLSVVVAVLMIIAYLASLFFSLSTHKHLYVGETDQKKASWSKTKSISVLLAAMVGVGIMSEILVGSIEPLVQSFGLTELFIGVVFVAIIGNAAEHTTAITVAMKNKMDLALHISIGSATQIVMFVAPFLVLLSLFFGEQMNLVFNSFELVSIIFAVFMVNSIVDDGKSNWFEGVQLLIAYLIIAVAFFFHP